MSQITNLFPAKKNTTKSAGISISKKERNKNNKEIKKKKKDINKNESVSENYEYGLSDW